VNSVCDLFQEWRRTKKRGAPIPDALWKAAVGVARKHGLAEASRVLSIEYGVLKRRMETEDAGRAADFIELKTMPIPQASVAVGPVVEVVDSDGARLVVRLPGSGTLDVASLVSAFRRGRA
jgi:hypothetical protein